MIPDYIVTRKNKEWDNIAWFYLCKNIPNKPTLKQCAYCMYICIYAVYLLHIRSLTVVAFGDCKGLWGITWILHDIFLSYMQASSLITTVQPSIISVSSIPFSHHHWQLLQFTSFGVSISDPPGLIIQPPVTQCPRSFQTPTCILAS